MKTGVLSMLHINFFSMCSYGTKVDITRSADSLNGQPVILIALFHFCLWLLTIYHAVMNLLFIYKKNKQYKIYIRIHLLAKQNDSFFKKWI